MMGDDSIPEASPAHRVRVSVFWMGKYPVTQRLWQTVMGNNPSRFTGERRPVEPVSWDDVQIFLQKLNSLPEVQAFIGHLDEPPGTECRRPTEAEWEYAARGDRRKYYKYSGSDSAKQVAWYRENMNLSH